MMELREIAAEAARASTELIDSDGKQSKAINLTKFSDELEKRGARLCMEMLSDRSFTLTINWNAKGAFFSQDKSGAVPVSERLVQMIGSTQTE